MLQTFFILLLSIGVLSAVGGQSQDDLECDAREHKGVGVVRVQIPGFATGQMGTFQILPQSQGRLCLTAAHVLEDDCEVFVEMGDVSLKVEQSFKHPTLDVAILKIASAFPNVFEADLPQLPVHMNWHSKDPLIAEFVGFGCSSGDDSTHYGQVKTLHGKKRKGCVAVKIQGKTFASWWRPYDHSLYSYAAAGDSGGPLINDNTLIGITMSTSHNAEMLMGHMALIDSAEHMRLQESSTPCIAVLNYFGHDAAFAYGDVVNSKVKVFINTDIPDVEKVIEFKALGLYIHNELALTCVTFKPNGFQFAQKIIDYLLSCFGSSSGFERKSVFQSLEPCLPWIQNHIEKNDKITDA